MPTQVIVGTYTESLAHVEGKAEGILQVPLTNAGLGQSSLQAVIRNPSWLAITQAHDFLYSVVETVTFDDHPGGGVVAFRRDVDTGDLTLLNTASSEGTEPAFVALDPSERFVLVANYRDGSVAVFPRTPAGELGQCTDVIRHHGSSVHPLRQTNAHAHQVVFDPITGNVAIPDLGLDAVLFYQLTADGKLITTDTRIDLRAGAGPRHIAFHPDGNRLFVLNELDNTLVSFQREKGGFVEVQRLSTLPDDYNEHSQTSALRISLDGKNIYAANRGHDSIAVFRLDQEGFAHPIQHESTRGREPRDFILAPGGRLIVGNQNSDCLVTFETSSDGRLRFLGSIDVPTPVCLVAVVE